MSLHSLCPDCNVKCVPTLGAQYSSTMQKLVERLNRSLEDVKDECPCRNCLIKMSCHSNCDAYRKHVDDAWFKMVGQKEYTDNRMKYYRRKTHYGK